AGDAGSIPVTRSTSETAPDLRKHRRGRFLGGSRGQLAVARAISGRLDATVGGASGITLGEPLGLDQSVQCLRDGLVTVGGGGLVDQRGPDAAVAGAGTTASLRISFSCSGVMSVSASPAVRPVHVPPDCLRSMRECATATGDRRRHSARVTQRPL